MENKDDLIRLFREVAEKHQFSAALIEKDYHLTRILHQVSVRQIRDLVFKGGTCLNKCYFDFNRLSEDLDFVYNQEVKDWPKSQLKKIVDQLRREFFVLLEELGFITDRTLGAGWKMLTSETSPSIVGLEITARYTSLIDGAPQAIKIEVSFRKSLRKPTQQKTIGHKFIDALGEPVLRKNVEIEVIDLVENFAEKFRALITRKRLAIRDIYDIYFILKNELVAINREVITLILAKANESQHLTEDLLFEFIQELGSRIPELNEKEIAALIRSDEKIDVQKMVQLIMEKFILEKRKFIKKKG